MVEEVTLITLAVTAVVVLVVSSVVWFCRRPAKDKVNGKHC